jgi:hypothetical protein
MAFGNRLVILQAVIVLPCLIIPTAPQPSIPVKMRRHLTAQRHHEDSTAKQGSDDGRGAFFTGLWAWKTKYNPHVWEILYISAFMAVDFVVFSTTQPKVRHWLKVCLYKDLLAARCMI